MIDDELQRPVLDEFKRLQTVARFLPGIREKRYRVGDACHADERGLHIADGGIKAQGCCRNDAKRTLGAYEKLFQVITGRVFPQRAQTIPDTAIRQYDLEAQN